MSHESKADLKSAIMVDINGQRETKQKLQCSFKGHLTAFNSGGGSTVQSLMKIANELLLFLTHIVALNMIAKVIAKWVDTD